MVLVIYSYFLFTKENNYKSELSSTSTGQITRLGIVDIWLFSGKHTADIQPTYGLCTADRQLIDGWYTLNIRPKTDSKFFITCWKCEQFIRLICS